jgi:hypothetical protein
MCKPLFRKEMGGSGGRGSYQFVLKRTHGISSFVLSGMRGIGGRDTPWWVGGGGTGFRKNGERFPDL